MEKISYFAVGALGLMIGGANAAHVINGNPLYNPAAGRFYNIFQPVEFDTKFERFVMADEFGYGVSDAFAIHVATSGSYDSSDHPEFGKWSWNDLEFGFDWDLWSEDQYHAEIYGDVKQIYNTKENLQTVAYNWAAGARVGRMTDNWTVVGIVQLDYLNDDLPQDTFDAWAMTVGLQGQYILNQNWNVVGEMLFDYDLFGKYYDGERLRFGVGLNYNIDVTKYVGVYTSKDVVHSFDKAPMKFGLVFGADF